MSGGARPAFTRHPTADTTAPAPSFTPAGGPLAIRQLRLTEFRNYRRLRLDLEPLPVVLVGDNGAGKTNLLEAVSFLAPGRGLRRRRLGEVTGLERPRDTTHFVGLAVRD